MSELKATTAQEIVRNEKDCDYMDELFGGVKMPPTQVYLKSEADAFIADLEESHKKEVEQLLIEIVRLKDKLQNVSELLKETRYCLIDSQKLHKRCADNAVNVIRHHKYKRCLDNAKMCRLEQERIELIENQDITDDDFNKLAKGFYKKWHKRWLKIAEKFKDVK
jgi:hypothetical protein